MARGGGPRGSMSWVASFKTAARPTTDRPAQGFGLVALSQARIPRDNLCGRLDTAAVVKGASPARWRCGRIGSHEHPWLRTNQAFGEGTFNCLGTAGIEVFWTPMPVAKQLKSLTGPRYGRCTGQSKVARGRFPGRNRSAGGSIVAGEAFTPIALLTPALKSVGAVSQAPETVGERRFPDFSKRFQPSAALRELPLRQGPPAHEVDSGNPLTIETRGFQVPRISESAPWAIRPTHPEGRSAIHPISPRSFTTRFMSSGEPAARSKPTLHVDCCTGALCAHRIPNCPHYGRGPPGGG